jgi:hypothetical protein
MVISTPDTIGLSAGLTVWVCAIIYFLWHPRKRTATDVDISNALGWDVLVSKSELTKSKSEPTNSLFKRFSSTKQFEQQENDEEPPYEFSETGSDVLISTYDGRKVGGVTCSSKRIDLDGCSVSRNPTNRSIKRLQNSSKADMNVQNVKQLHEDCDGEHVISRRSSSLRL